MCVGVCVGGTLTTPPPPGAPQNLGKHLSEHTGARLILSFDQV